MPKVLISDALSPRAAEVFATREIQVDLLGVRLGILPDVRVGQVFDLLELWHRHGSLVAEVEPELVLVDQ